MSEARKGQALWGQAAGPGPGGRVNPSCPSPPLGSPEPHYPRGRPGRRLQTWPLPSTVSPGVPGNGTQ